MKRRSILDDDIFAFLKHAGRVDFTNGQIPMFLSWLYDKGFLDNLSMGDLIDFYSKTDCIWLPLLRNDGVTVGIDSAKDYFRVGIDPSKYFDKVSRCSIVVTFPFTSKREEKLFYRTLEALMDKSSRRYRDWFREARSSYHGAYLSNAS